MTYIVAFALKTGIRVAEIGFLLILIAGVWLFAAQIPQLRLGAARTAVAGLLLAVGALLIIIAVHWGHFGHL